MAWRGLFLTFVLFAWISSHGQSPGGVSTNLGLWLKADNGPENSSNLPAANGEGIATWRDRSGLGRDYAGVAGPTLVAGALNNNAAVEILAGGFDGPAAAALGTNWTLFTVSQKLASDNNGRVFDGHTGNFLWSHWGTFTNSIFLNGNPSNFNSGIATTVGIQDLRLHVYRREATGGTLEARADGTSLTTFGSSNSASGIRIDINQGAFSTESSHSRIGEMIIYNGALTAAEILRIESYLGIKYGLTINHDYLASTGATVWDFAANAGFNSRITVVGRDDASGLDQRTSTSLVPGADLTIAAPGAFGSNLSFVAMGDNNAANGTSTDVPAGFARRLNRVWRSSTIGTPGNVNISIDLRDLGLPFGLTAASYSLLTDNDGVFADASSVAGTSIANGVVTFNSVALSTGFVTVSVSTSALIGPANVTENLRLWLKADAGVTGVSPISSWADQSGNGFTATAPGNAPVLLSNQINGNPSVDFASANAQYLSIAGGIFGTATFNDTWVYVVQQVDAIQNSTTFYEGLSGGERFSGLIPWGDGNVYVDYANGGGGRINGPWGGAINNYYLWTLGSSTGTSTPTGTRKAISRDGQVIVSNNNNDTGTGNNQTFLIGGGYATGIGTSNPFDGKIAEMIVYTGVPSALDQEKVQSYLSFKYGITKNSADLAGTVGQDERDYFGSNNAVVWDFDFNLGYNNRITALARDNGSQLLQLTSRGTLAGSALTLASSSIGTDNSFLIVGDDNGALTSSSANVPSGYTRRVTRIWRTQLTGSPGAASISFDLTSGIFNSGNAADYALVIKNSNADFSTGATLHTAGRTIVNNVLTFTGVNFTSGDYFTLVQNIVTPLASQSPVFWVKGAAGITGSPDVSLWADQSGSGTNAVQNTPANQPTFTANDVNGNPTLNFSGNTDIMSLTNAPANLNSTIFTVGVPNVNANWRTMFRGAANDHPILIQAGGTTLGYFDNDNGGLRSSGFTWLQGEVAVIAAELRAGNVNFRKNGSQGASINTIDLSGLNLNFFGNFQGNNQQFGRIAEAIIYNSPSPLTTAEKEIIESYLGAKYGTTLTHNYTTTGGAVYWNFASNAAYNNRVVVIGKDDGSGLDQRRSRSTQTANPVLTLEKTVPATPFGSNFDFVAAGDDNGLLTATTTNVHSSRPMRVSRIWKSSILGSPGNVNISFDLGTGIFNSGNAADYRLLISTTVTPDFTAASEISGATLVSNVLTFSNVVLPNDAFFTLGLPVVPSPGGVVNNLRSWFRADAGVTGGPSVSGWLDQTSNAFLAAQGTVANQPQLLSNRLNFNPALQFNGTTHQLTINGGILQTATYTDINIFAVSRANAIQNNGLFAENVAGGQLIGRVPWGDNNVYWDAGLTGAPNRLAINWGGTVNTGFLWSLLASTSSTALGSRQNILRDGLLLASDGDLNAVTGNGSNMNIGSTGGGNFLNGEISEFLVYTGPLSAPELRRIQSYLAVKYGITIDQSIPANYVASNGNVIWDAIQNAGYANRIAGVGRDLAALLDQRKSRSVSSGSVLTIEKADDTTPFADINFVVVGDNGGSLGATTNNVASPYPMRVTRIWRADLTGTPGLVDLSFELGTGIFNSGVQTDYALIIKTADTNFESGSTVITGGVITGSVLKFDNVNLGDNDYFTLALPRIAAPGGVITGLGVWLKANTGVFADAGVTPAVDGGSVQRWADQTSLANNATQTGTPIYNTSNNLINFNPTIFYDGSSGHNLSYSTVNQFTLFTMGRLEGTLNRRLFSSRIGNALTGTWSGREDVFFLNGNPSFLTGIAATTNPRLYTTLRANSGAYQFFRNGQLLYGATPSAATTWQYGIANGGSTPAESSRGFVSEVIQYDRDLTAAEINRVQSYLAIKYGVTLNQLSPANYVASNGSVIWNATTNSGYAENIAGIGRDDASGLSQVQSQSINPNPIVSMNKGGAFSNDLDFVMWGSNNAYLSPTTVDAFSAAYPFRLGRVWRVDISGTPGDVTVTFDLSGGIYNSTNASDYALLIHSSTAFASGVAHITGRSLSGSTLTFTNVNFADGDYFTLGMPTPPAPGGVVNNLNLWVKANQGVTGVGSASAWADQSGNNFNLTQATGGNQPAILPNQFNFNPSLQFDGSNDNLQNASGTLGNNTFTDVYSFAVSRTNVVQNSYLFFESTAAGGQFSLRAPWSDGNIYWEPGNTGTNRVFGNWGGNTTSPFLWALTASTSATPSGQRQDILRNGFSLASDLTMSAFSGNSSAFSLGSGGGSFFRGEVGELVIYRGPLTATEMNRVQGYLAIKYGITLNGINYLNAAGTSVYNLTSTHASYAADIAGIGRDDASALSQLRSRSVNAPADAVAMANGNFTTPVAFGNTNQFLVWGHNARSAQADVAVPAITHASVNIQRYLARVWSTQLTGSPTGSVLVEVDMTRIAGTNDPNQIRLLLDNDAVFGNGSSGEFTYAGSVSGSLIYFTVPYANINAPQAFFTIGSVDASLAPLAIPAPGGVVGNMRVWLRANAGVTGATPVSSWQDQSTNSFVATAPGNAPDLVNNAFNNNPALDFTRSNNEFLQITNGIMGSSTYSDAWIYVVSQANSVLDQTVLYERMAIGETFNVLVPWGDANTYFDFGVTSGVGRVFGNWGANTSTHFLWTYGTSISTSTPNGTRKAIARDGAVIISNNNNDSATGANQNFLIGGGYNSGVGTTNPFNGRVAEVIVFGEVPTTLEQERVHSYLGIKYGISKNSVDVAGTPAIDERDYFAANGIVVWDFSDNAPFNSRVAGIARDDASGLNQLRSQNKNPQAIVTMEKTGALTNQDFLLWGDDNGLLGLTTAGANSILPYRSGRVWRVDQQGSPGAINVSFELGGPIYNSGNAADYRLLVGNSPTSFAAASVFSGTISTNVITFNGVTFTDGQYFTLAIANMPAPGGVVPNLHYWVKADLGVVGSGNASAWNDQSGNGFDATQTTAASQPTILANRTNFNPSIQFDGGNDRLSVTGGILGSAIYTDFNVFALTRVNTVSNSSLFYELQGSPAAQFNAHLPWGDNNLYWDAGSANATNRIFTNWGGATNTNFLWNLLSSTTNTVSGPGNRQEIFRNGRRIANDNTMNSFGNGVTPPNAFFLGSSSGGNFFNGEVSELAMYRGPLSLSQMQRIQSYLAIKWGLSLDQTTPTSYYASDWNGTTGTVVWNAATAGVFRTDITAIGRDDLSALSARQSASINTGNILTIGNTAIAASNAANPNNFGADRSFFAWAHNNGAVAALNVTDFGTTVNSEVIEARIARTWLANETGTVGTLRVRFNLSAVPGVGGVAGDNNLANVRLLVDADGTFATGATSISPAFADNSTDIVEFNHDFTAGTGFYFTIGSTNRLDAPLPVELLFFTAKPTSNGVELSWATSSEKNNDYFVVEKSITPDVWSAVTNVKGQGTKTTRSDYAAIDAAPLAATVYYRLRQVDLDGAVRYSNVVRVTTETEELVIYPNPSNGRAVSIVVNPRDGVQGGLEVSSLQGLVLKRWDANFTEGRQLTWTVAADDLAPGVYLVTLRTGGRTVVKRLVVVK